MVKWKAYYAALLSHPGRVWVPSEVRDISYAFSKYLRAEKDLEKIVGESCFESPKP